MFIMIINYIYILLIILTLDINQNPKDIELRIAYENKQACLKASKKLDFSFKFPEKNVTTKSECILKRNKNSNENIET